MCTKDLIKFTALATHLDLFYESVSALVMFGYESFVAFITACFRDEKAKHFPKISY